VLHPGFARNVLFSQRQNDLTMFGLVLSAYRGSPEAIRDNNQLAAVSDC